MDKPEILIAPLNPVIGAEVTGLDLSEPLGPETCKKLHAAWLEHLVLFFRDQPLEPEEQIALARRFGRLDVHAFGRHLPDEPEVGLLDQSEPERDGANRWHTDSTFMNQPPKAALLRAVKLPGKA